MCWIYYQTEMKLSRTVNKIILQNVPLKKWEILQFFLSSVFIPINSMQLSDKLLTSLGLIEKYS